MQKPKEKENLNKIENYFSLYQNNSDVWGWAMHLIKVIFFSFFGQFQQVGWLEICAWAGNLICETLTHFHTLHRHFSHTWDYLANIQAVLTSLIF